jgi:hypothetical protein
MYVRFEVFTAVTMKNAVFWDVAPCRSGSSLADFSTLKFGGDIFLRSVGSHKIYTATYPRRQHSSNVEYFAEKYCGVAPKNGL